MQWCVMRRAVDQAHHAAAKDCQNRTPCQRVRDTVARQLSAAQPIVDTFFSQRLYSELKSHRFPFVSQIEETVVLHCLRFSHEKPCKMEHLVSLPLLQHGMMSLS